MARCAYRLTTTALAILTLGAASTGAAPAIRQVLVLQSFDRGNLAIDAFTGNFRVELDQRAGQPVNVVQIAVSPAGSPDARERAVVDYIRATFAERPPDLLVSVGGSAAAFGRKYRDQLFPAVPWLLAAGDQRFMLTPPLVDNETAVAIDNDYARLVDDILQLVPDTRQVFMIMGHGQLAQLWHERLELEFDRFKDRLTFVWSDDLSLQEILRRCAQLPPHSAIFYFAFGTDAVGGAYADERVLDDLHAVANAPMFAAQSPLFGRGIVGGTMLSIEEVSRRAADVATRVLNGEPANRTRSASLRPSLLLFDARELEHWGIPESRLPAGSVVRFRGPSLWNEHKITILTAIAALIIQSALIVGLLYHRRARHRAEIESRRNLALAADASRRETMSALTSSISHELSQPLNAMMHNTQALRMMIAAARATPDTIAEILGDIEHQSIHATQIIDRHRTMMRTRQMDQRPIDLHAVIRESIALVSHDMRARHVQFTLNLPPAPYIVDGDPVMLQQVLVNLVMNAMDAMADGPADQRLITIVSEVRAEEVDVSVRDTGPGLPPHVNGTLFTPFVTTKPNGLGIGLTIARTIVEAHRGVISAHNGADGGATFTITLRRSAAPAAVAAS